MTCIEGAVPKDLQRDKSSAEGARPRATDLAATVSTDELDDLEVADSFAGRE